MDPRMTVIAPNPALPREPTTLLRKRTPLGCAL